ncbi:PaaI family thioesterase [Pseudomonas nicosulfuronedens]|uniref:PaaI family thioesterase n=1 Tax=Pseudomonas nicosulfuronedens TaxID=2571105 RepID=A0A5R9QM81_9PSED|nr:MULTISPECIES: PaaI family thioesterase [Pseudomonas]TLX70638.1 PaaI family thioesterase [Pseudomonas nicosulfuronedens]
MSTNSPTPGKAIRYADYRIEVPFLDHLDVLVEPHPDSPTLVVELQRKHLNGGEQAHGGLMMTLLDMAMAAAARNSSKDGGFCVTVEMKSNFLRPGGGIGGRLAARGKLRHASKSLAFCDGELLDAEGRLIATASGTFKFVNRSAGDAP